MSRSDEWYETDGPGVGLGSLSMKDSEAQANISPVASDREDDGDISGIPEVDVYGESFELPELDTILVE